MMGKKGQGALEYLLILAAVLAIAVVVILVANQIMSPARESTVLNSDKFECAKVGIELKYETLPDGAGDVKVVYQGQALHCSDDNAPDTYDAACRIHFSDESEHTLYVNETNCIVV